MSKDMPKIKGAFLYDADSREIFLVEKVREVAFGLYDTVLKDTDGGSIPVFLTFDGFGFRILKDWSQYRRDINTKESLSFLKEVEWIDLQQESTEKYVF